ncbi:MAG: chitobiase/beta-hexosaminidase C-terminal domain-containing protein [Bacteroidales bacterium]|nr:chitobiase/beta-hexosaminidase C-terminal domain-containing protein [Bacteroidales bacterium]
MRKLFYSLLAAAMLPAMALAETVTVDFTAQGAEDGTQATRIASGDVNVSFSAGMNMTAPRYYNNMLRVNAYNTITVDTSVGTIQEVTFVADDDALPFSPSAGVMDGNTCSEIGVAKVVFTNNSVMQYNLSSMTITYDTAPAISPASGTYYEAQTITIAGVEGTTYYTLDGTDPTLESTEYTEPFVISESCTVKAATYTDEQWTNVTTREYVITAPTEVANFTEAAANCDVRVLMTSPMLVVGQENTNLYVIADGEPGLLYLEEWTMVNGPATFDAGDMIAAGVQLEYYDFENNEAWLPMSDLTVESTGNEVPEPTVVTDFATLNDSLLNAALLLEGTYYNASTYMIEDAEGNELYPQTLDYMVDYPDGSGPYNVRGFLARAFYGSGYWVIVSEFIYNSTVALPVINVDPYTDYLNYAPVTITADEGCKVYYTIDGSEPTIESTLYVGEFNVYGDGRVTIKAIAQGEDGTLSGVAMARVYITAVTECSTFAEANELGTYSVATFNFPMTVIYHANIEAGRDMFVKAGDEYARIYDIQGTLYMAGLEYAMGDVIPAGATVTVYPASWYDDTAVYYVPFEAFGESTENVGTIEPIAVANIADLASEPLYSYCELQQVESEEQGWYSVVLTDANGDEIELDTQYCSVPAGTWYVQGFPIKDTYGDLVFMGVSYSEESIIKSSAIRSAAVDTLNGHIYNLQGIDCGTDASRLTPGIYIINGVKTRIR